jgi:hypothetical protein
MPTMPVYITYFIQLLLIIHVLKTGRDRYWIWLLLFLPMIGGVAYLLVEILPDFSRSITGQRTRRGVRNVLDPGADIRAQAAAWEQSPNAENGRRYAQALLAASRAQEAEEILGQALSGFFSDDPALMLLKAQALFSQEKWEQALLALQQIQENNPELRSPEGHLLYARCLEKTGQTGPALEEFRSVAGYFPGAEARYRLAMALGKAGQDVESREEFRGMIRDAELAPRHFRNSEKSWLDAARKELGKSPVGKQMKNP